MRKLLLGLALGAMILGTTAGTAHAIPFTGKVDYVGSFSTAPSPSFLAPTNSVAIISASVLDVTNVSGNLATLIVPPTALLHAPTITYDPATPVAPLWSHASGVSFDLTSFSVITRTAQLLTLRGVGVFKGAGYDDTVGSWVMTLNRATGGQVTGTYSASSSIPEPALLGLLGLGLVGLARSLRARRR